MEIFAILMSIFTFKLCVYTLIIIVFAPIIIMISKCFIFKKGKFDGWEAIIPIYKVFIELKILRLSYWWAIPCFLPIANIFFKLYLKYRLAKSFQLNIWFAIGLIFLPFIFYPLLAFGDYKYKPLK